MAYNYRRETDVETFLPICFNVSTPWTVLLNTPSSLLPACRMRSFVELQVYTEACWDTTRSWLSRADTDWLELGQGWSYFLHRFRVSSYEQTAAQLPEGTKGLTVLIEMDT